jgi:hypothetical protein
VYFSARLLNVVKYVIWKAYLQYLLLATVTYNNNTIQQLRFYKVEYWVRNMVKTV